MEPNKKTNKQTKYNQRHRNKEETNSNKRGGGRGIRGKEGEGFSRNMYERPMDKDPGERGIECRRWGWVERGRVMEGKWGQL